MKRPEPFEIFQPTSIQEAREIHAHRGPGGYFLAGGTDLVIAIKEKGLVPRYVVDLKRIESLSGIRENPADGSLVIGALTTMRNLACDQQALSFSGAERGGGWFDSDSQSGDNWRKHRECHAVRGRGTGAACPCGSGEDLHVERREAVAARICFSWTRQNSHGTR